MQKTQVELYEKTLAHLQVFADRYNLSIPDTVASFTAIVESLDTMGQESEGEFTLPSAFVDISLTLGGFIVAMRDAENRG